MRSYVAADAVAENVFAEETFQHSQKTLAFSISDVVKGAVGVGFIRNRLLDGVSRRSCVAFHRDFLGDSGAASCIELASHKYVQVTGHRRRWLKTHFFGPFWQIDLVRRWTDSLRRAF